VLNDTANYMDAPPAAFMSYVNFDDTHEDGRLTEFCRRLSGEVRMQTGEEFRIFQDRKDIAWGQQWQHRIDESLDAATFLVAVITPSFFKSKACRDELERFLDREAKLRRGVLILPVYYLDCPILNIEAKRETDALAKVIAARQWADWRELRFEPFTLPQVGKMLQKMATQIVEASERGLFASLPALPAVLTAAAEKPVDQSAQDILEPSRGPTRKTEPPTHVVDPFIAAIIPVLRPRLKPPNRATGFSFGRACIRRAS
jgi:hypothetical protein